MDDCLPPGWTAYQDVGGPTYYCNEAGETTWTRPASSIPVSDCSPTSFCSLTVMPDIPASGTTLIASQFISQLAALPELIDAIDTPYAKRLAQQASDVQASIYAASAEDLAPDVRDLLYDTIMLPLLCPLVSEVIAAAFATLAGLMEPGIFTTGEVIDSGEAISVLESISTRVDAFQPFLFSILCRVDPIQTCGCKDVSSQRILVALSCACTWLVASLCRASGYTALTSSILWSWAEGDALWVAVLAKAILSLDHLIQLVPETPMNGALCPSDLCQIKCVVVDAVIKLVSADIAFAETLPLPGASTDEIQEPNVTFAKHWTKLAVAVVESELVGPLLEAVATTSGRRGQVELARFFARILQPELIVDPEWITRYPSAALVVEAARGAADQIRWRLLAQSSNLWNLFAAVSCAEQASRSFLRDCSEIAFQSSFPASDVMSLVRSVLSIQRDAKTMATLCALASNAQVEPSAADDGGLATALDALDHDTRMLVTDSLVEWPGVVQQDMRASWLAYLQGHDVSYVPAPDSSVATRWPLEAVHRAALCMSGLKDLLTGAPPELLCCLDNQLVTNPVRSPYGHVFEQTVLASALAQNGNVCPVTGEPLTLESCQCDWHLKRQAEVHINDWMHSVKWRQP